MGKRNSFLGLVGLIPALLAQLLAKRRPVLLRQLARGLGTLAGLLGLQCGSQIGLAPLRLITHRSAYRHNGRITLNGKPLRSRLRERQPTKQQQRDSKSETMVHQCSTQKGDNRPTLLDATGL